MTADTIDLSLISRATRTELYDIIQTLTIHRMKLDREMSSFLDTHEMDDSDTNTEQWQMYRERIKHYGKINSMIRTAQYYLNTHG